MVGMRRRGDRAARLRARLRYLWSDADPDGIELLSAALSLSFCFLLLYWGNRANAIDYAHAYALLCLVSSLSKFAGVLLEIRWLRLAGLALGTIFWITLAFVFLNGVPGSITWLCFTTLGLAQLWAGKQVWKAGV